MNHIHPLHSPSPLLLLVEHILQQLPEKQWIVLTENFGYTHDSEFVWVLNRILKMIFTQKCEEIRGQVEWLKQ
jgi:hypothetical protein